MAVDDAGGASVAVRVSFANFRTLPPNSRVLVRFDLDRNPSTGDQGDESHSATRATGRSRPSAGTGLSSSAPGRRHERGVLRRRAVVRGRPDAFRWSNVVRAARHRRPNAAGRGRSARLDGLRAERRQKRLLVARPNSFPDPDNDQDVAADITSISVVDTPSGSLQFRLTTANYTTLPPDKLIGLGIGLRGRPIEDDALFLGYLSGSRAVEVDREQQVCSSPCWAGTA